MEWPQQINGTPILYDAPLKVLLEHIKSRSAKTGPAFVALAAHSSEQSLAALVSMAKGKDADFRRAAVEAIACHSLGVTQAKLICDLFQDPDEIVVRAACRAAANLKLSESRGQILALLNSKNPKTREVALEALNNLWLDPDFEQVFKAHTTDRNSNVRKQAAWTLRKTLRRRTGAIYSRFGIKMKCLGIVFGRANLQHNLGLSRRFQYLKNFPTTETDMSEKQQRKR
jgi:hypothetical protein